MIKIENITKKFGRLDVLKGIDLEISPGKITAILGPNGSGKSTLIKSVLGMVIPDSGNISIDGVSVLGDWKYRNKISYLPQIASFPENLTVKNLIRMLKDIRQQPANESFLISLFKIEEFLDKRIKHLSGGTRQKVNLLLACMFNNPIIILDEPTTGLDPVSVVNLKNLIRQQKEEGTTIIFTTHIMSLVDDLADEIVFLLEGNIHYQGTKEQLKEKNKSKDLELAIANMLVEKKEIKLDSKPFRYVESLAI